MYNLPDFFRLAQNASLLSNFKNSRKMGSVLVYRKRILAFSSNYNKTHPVYADGNKWHSLHTEVRTVNMALRLGRSVAGADIYIYRSRADGSPALAKPCDFCFSFLLENGIRNVFFTIDIPPFYAIIQRGKLIGA